MTKERRTDVRADGSRLWLPQGVGSHSSLVFLLWLAAVETETPHPPTPLDKHFKQSLLFQFDPNTIVRKERRNILDAEILCPSQELQQE